MALNAFSLSLFSRFLPEEKRRKNFKESEKHSMNTKAIKRKLKTRERRISSFSRPLSLHRSGLCV
jgi:hypothetical protein